MEGLEIKNTLLEKKIGGYSFESDNYVAPGEITVTITLAEYRNLVEKCATRQEAINKANEERFATETENKKLKEEVAELQTQLYKLSNKKEAEDDF